MRLWSVHPQYLDPQALVACWREALLAQRVLAGRTTGYRSHPQLARFRAASVPADFPPGVGSGEVGGPGNLLPDVGPRVAIQAYLAGVADEADLRGYRFDRRRIGQDWALPLPDAAAATPRIAVTDGQLALEAGHLAGKVRVRSPDWWQRWRDDPGFGTVAHPLFVVEPGPVANWERARPLPA